MLKHVVFLVLYSSQPSSILLTCWNYSSQVHLGISRSASIATKSTVTVAIANLHIHGGSGLQV